ncbi:SDR family NAD(P)-dependent oxidoreductase [Pelosinus baikalensis]|uniref:SDR family oxidoreductase n=1 Tax=Pelosinus baikalensis TaxID=2892015 RepID=A0ABS8HNB0_9FIRM|nr:SDR family oxidoreductase [Pelosinus baikalensis]MCC5464643.1 SDR family oxidoreductase [Pelosinus baikalensis]
MKSNETIRVYNGAVAIITGGASGIGAALGRELAKRGCEVVLADRQIDLAEEIAETIRTAGGKASAAELDVTSFDAVEAMIYKIIKRTGRLDYMFNNAGIGTFGPASVYKIEDWDSVLDVNLRGVIHGIQVTYQIMREQGFGHIVNTASLAGLLPSPGSISYTTTKHAIVGLSKTLRIEAAPLGIRVSVLCPGFIRTPILKGGGKYGKMLMDISPQQQEKMEKMIEKLSPMPPEFFAVKAVDAIAKNKAIIVLPSWWKLFWWLERLFPTWSLHLAQKRYKTQVENFK